jgi:CHAD domain-containing protein
MAKPASGGKWISDLSAQTLPADAARRVLDVRLRAVREHLGHALRAAHEDPEHVHQLRVGTRRAVAALDIFAACLPEKIYARARKRMRRVRRAAGAARDWDVFLLEMQAVEKRQPPRQRAGLDFLTGYALGQREAAQGALLTAESDFPFAFERLVAVVLSAVRRPPAGASTLLGLARPALETRLQALALAASRDLDNYDNLHQVRIAGKRLRYAMEVFADCFPPPFRTVHYPAVEEMQEILGRANDSHVAGRRLRALAEHLQGVRPDAWKRYRKQVESLIQFHDQRLPEERQRFEEWWRRWERSGGEAAFAGLLKSAGQVFSA